jgi:hypothetical protein
MSLDDAPSMKTVRRVTELAEPFDALRVAQRGSQQKLFGRFGFVAVERVILPPCVEASERLT